MADGRDKPGGQPGQPKAPPGDEALFGTGAEEWESDLAAWDIALPIASGLPAAASAGLEPAAMPDVENPFAATPVTVVATSDPGVVPAEWANAGGTADLDDGGEGPASDSYAVLVTTVGEPSDEAILVGLAPDPGLAAPAARLPATAPGQPSPMARQRSVLPGTGARTAPAGARPGAALGRGRDVPPKVSATAPTVRTTPAHSSAPRSAPSVPSRPPASADRGSTPGKNRPPAPARRERPSRPWPVLPGASEPVMPGARLPGERLAGGVASPPQAVPPPAGASRPLRIERPLTDPTDEDGPTRVFRLPVPPPLEAEPSPTSATFGIPMGTTGGFVDGAEPDDSYAAILTDEDRSPPTIFDADPSEESPQPAPRPALVEMSAAFWQAEGGASISVTPDVQIAGLGPASLVALRELLADELAHEADVARRVDLALGAAHLAALGGDDRQARAHVEEALALDVPDSMASAARPGWSAVHRARLILAERAGELAGGEGPGAESLARLALLPHTDQAAYRQLQAEWTLARAASGVAEGSAAARAAATPPGLPKTLAEAELAWRDSAAAATMLAAAGQARPGPLGAALLALAAARSEMARDFQAAAEQRYDQVAFEERRGLVRMGMLRDVARLEPDASAAALDGLLPTFAPSPLKVALARWAARLATQLGRYDEAWALVATPATLGPSTPALARDRVDLRGRARATPVRPVEAAELLAALTDSSSGALAGRTPRPAARAVAVLNACAWAAEPELVAAALDRVDELVSGGADAEAAACLGAVVEELARRATDVDAQRRALATWQRVDAARWLPAAFDLAAVAAPADRESIWREVARRHPESPVFLRLSAALASAGRQAEAAELLYAGSIGWGQTPLSAPLVELSAEVLSAVDLAAACERLEGLVAAQTELGEGEDGARVTLGRALRRLGERSSSGDPAVTFSIRDRWTAFARAEPVQRGSGARRAALLLEEIFWRPPGGLLSDEELLDEALELVPFHPVAIALALASPPDPRTMPRRWLAEGGIALGGRRRIQAAVWMALGGDVAAALAVVSALLPAPVAATEAPAGNVVLAVGSDGAGQRATSAAEAAEAATVGPAARRFARRLAWAETSARARSELLARLATGTEASADALVEAAEDAVRGGDRVRAARLLHRASRAAGAELVAGELRVGLDPLAAISATAGQPTKAGGGEGGLDRLSRLEHAARELRFADVVTCLADAPPQEQAPDAPTLSLAIEIDEGRSAGRRLAELLARAPRASADPAGPAPDRALGGAQAPLVFWASVAGGAGATPLDLEAAASVALDLGDARSAGLLLIEAAVRAEATAAPDAVAERLLRGAIKVDPTSSPAASSWRRFLVRTLRLAEAADAGAAEAGALVEPGLQVQALVRAAALSVMLAPAAPEMGTTDLAGPRARAATFLRRALQIAPADVDVFSKLRDVYERMGDHAALAGLLEHRLAHTSNPFEMTALHLARAELLAGPLGDRVAAKAQLLLILAKEPQHGRALLRLADLEEEAGNVAQAAELLMQRAAGERSPEKLRELFLRLGRIHSHRAPDPKRAVAAYARVLQLDANNREALDALSLLYIGLGETRSASAITERLVRVETSPERRTAYHVRLGQLAERAGDPRATAQHFRRAVAESPRNLQALAELIRFLGKTHDAVERRHVLDIAASDLRAAFLARPTDALIRDAFVAVQRWRGRPAAAAAAIELGMLLGLPAPDDSSNGEEGSQSSSVSAGRRLVALANPAVDDRTFPVSVPSSVRHLFRLIGPFERPGQRADLARFGVDRSHRIAEGRAPRDLLDGIAADLGTGVYELFVAPGAVSPGARAPLAALPARPPAIVIASAIVQMGPDAIRFAAGRTLRLSSAYLDTALAGTEHDLAAWLVGVVRQFVPTYRRDDVPADLTDSTTARMARLIPRRARQEILPFALESSGEIDLKALSLGIREGANRVGVLAGSRLDIAVRVVLAVNGVEPSADAVRTHIEARALVEFCLSDEHDDLVRMLG